MKKLAKKALLGSGVLRLAAGFRENSAAILMYHSVRQDPGAVLDSIGGIAHSGAVFRGQMELISREFHPMSLDQLAESLHSKGQLPGRAVVVTFDDGYADNYETAMPILNQAGVPGVFYITVDCVEKRRLPWPGRLRFIFLKSRARAWRDPAGKEWLLDGDAAREKAFAAACETCCRFTGAAQDDFITAVKNQLSVFEEPSLADPENGSPMMSYDQIRDLHRHGHLIGSHTISHPNMAYVGADEAQAELAKSKKHLEQELGEPVVHFSYPCPALSPHWNDFTIASSGEAGYETAVTTDWGLVRTGDDALRLKRVLPTKSVDGLRWNLECVFAGRSI